MIDLENSADKTVYNEMVNFLHQKGHQISWTAAIRLDNGKLVANHHKNRPCYGEMRNYGGNSTRPKDYQPGDLPRPIRLGLREGVAVYIPTAGRPPVMQDYFRYIFSEKSPYRTGFDVENMDLIPHPETEGAYSGIIIRSGDFKPTVLLQLLIQLREVYVYGFAGTANITVSWNRLKELFPGEEDSFYHFLATYFFGQRVHTANPSWSWTPMFSYGSGYCQSWNVDPYRFMIGSPFDLDDGKVWSDPCDYNRPWLPELFNPLVEGLDTTSPQSSPKIMNSQAAGIKSWPARLKEKAGISNVAGHLRDEHMLEICKVFKGLIEEERVKNA